VAREEWAGKQAFFNPAKLIFIDESSINAKMARLCGRACTGERCIAAIPYGHWMTTIFTARGCAWANLSLRCFWTAQWMASTSWLMSNKY
jgi:hypothetical protein